MEEINRRALLREVRRSQTVSQILRTAIMVASRCCTFIRWVPYFQANGSITWEHKDLKLGESLKTPFSREIDGERGLLQRIHAVKNVREVSQTERITFADDASGASLKEASLALATLIPALQTIVCHAQEYGTCADCPRLEEDTLGTTDIFRAGHLDEVLLSSLGKPNQAQFALRIRATTWLRKAHIVYLGDQHRPADRGTLPTP